jgi:hypothetical protein
MINLEDVFKKSGLPTYTFVQPLEYNNLLVSLRTKGRGLVVEGPSGIGKTTCIIKILEDTGLNKRACVLSGRNKGDIEIIRILPETTSIGLVIIDDFHRLDDATKSDIANLIKHFADKENPNEKIVIIGINKAGDSLLHFAHDLTGRIDTIRFEANPEEKLIELIRKGEERLNIQINIADDIVKEAQGSFHLTQMLCHETCIYSGILNEQKEKKSVETSIEVVKQKTFDDLATTFLAKARKFATGPRLRREGRAPYFYLLYWLATNDDWSLQIDDMLTKYSDHKDSIGQIVDKDYLSNFLDSNPDLSDVIHFDSRTKVLGIEDPKFVYFIHNIIWSKFSRQVGYPQLSFPSLYDFALSFAGSDRILAEGLYDKLTAKELHVFYDKNEQHRILATNIEDYLGPIYKSESQFVIAILGPDYPKKIWTKFESEQFKDRFGQHAVIPVWLSTAPAGIFDETSRIGGLSIDINADIDSQLGLIADILSKRIEEERYKNSPPK